MTPLDRAARALDKAIPKSESGTFYIAPGWSKEMIARVVLQAIREPSEGMLAAGFEDYPTIWSAALTPEDRVGIYQAMIDAALEEG